MQRVQDVQKVQLPARKAMYNGLHIYQASVAVLPQSPASVVITPLRRRISTSKDTLLPLSKLIQTHSTWLVAGNAALHAVEDAVSSNPMPSSNLRRRELRTHAAFRLQV